MCYRLSLIIRQLALKKVTYGFSRICKPAMLDNQTVKPFWSKKVTTPFLRCYRLGASGGGGFDKKVTHFIKFRFSSPQVLKKNTPRFYLHLNTPYMQHV